MIARSIIFLTAWLSILTIVAGNAYDSDTNYITKAEESGKELLECAVRAKKSHRATSLFHAYFSGEQHREASLAHAHKEGKFLAMMHSGKGGDQKSLSNEVAFRVYNVNQHRLEKCESSAAHAKSMHTHLELAWENDDDEAAEFHRQKALDGAPYKLPKCGKEPAYWISD